MNILLMGEYSSAHNYLKIGLEQLGHNVDLASDGDGWKKIPGGTIELYKIKGNSITKKRASAIYSSINNLKTILNDKYDVIQFINPIVYHWAINPFLVNKIIKFYKEKCISLYCCGVDAAQCKAWKEGKFEHYIYDYTDKAGYLYLPNNLRSMVCIRNDEYVVEKCDVLIPAMYDYEVGYLGNKKLSSVVPLPIDVDSIQYTENVIDDKIVIYHGLSNAPVKGSNFIVDALDRIKNEFQDDVEVIVKERMPFAEYKEFMKRANIVIDQCLAYAYGINTCIGLAEGKVVMSCVMPETIKSFGLKEDECPIIPIHPNSDQIYNQIKSIILKREQIYDMGKRSRAYVEKMHDCKKIANQFVDIWKSTGRV